MACIDVKLDMYAEWQEIKDKLMRMLLITFMYFPHKNLWNENAHLICPYA